MASNYFSFSSSSSVIIFLSSSLIILLFLMIISPSFPQQRHGPPTVRLLLNTPVPQASTTAVQGQAHQTSSYDILSTVLVLVLILSALLKLISILKGQKSVSTAPQLLPIHHATFLLQQPTSGASGNDVFVMQQAPPAPPHSHSFHLSIRELMSMAAAAVADDVGMDDGSVVHTS